MSSLAERFSKALRCRAAIVGPHGSGKSTLLEHLVPLIGRVAFRQSAYQVRSDEGTEQVDGPNVRNAIWLQMRGKGPSYQLLLRSMSQWARPESILVIDGYEQMTPIGRATALLVTRAKRAGLLLTSHKPTAVATLVETKVDAQTAQWLLEQLLPTDLEQRDKLLDEARLAKSLARHHGNLRELFMEMYDQIQR